MKNHIKRRYKLSLGFTVIELLTVIALLAVLAVILIPSVEKARTNALRAESASNLRQVFAACGLYSNDNNSRLLNSWIGPDEETGRPQGSWCIQLIEGGYLSDGGIAYGRQNYEVLGSPIQRREASDVTIDKDPPRYATYGMNAVLAMIRRDAPLSSAQISMSRLLAPGRTLYISEGNLPEGKEWFGVSVNPWNLPNNTDGIVTIVYADGHIGQMQEDELPTRLGKEYSESWYFWKGYK